MRRILVISLLLLAGTTGSWAAPVDSAAYRRIDSLSFKVGHWLWSKGKDDLSVDTISSYVEEALQESRKIGYQHGVAVTLACQALIMDIHANNFPRAEQLARESLEWFDQTADKRGITLAHFVLGFALFAQSHFDEALRHYDLAREYAIRAGDHHEAIFMTTMKGEAYRERGDYEKAFDILRTCAQTAEFFHQPELARKEYLLLAELFVQIEDYSTAEKYFRLGFGNDPPEKAYSWDVMNYTELLTHEHKYDSALYYFGKFDSAHLPAATLRSWLVSKGEYYLHRSEYATALPYLLRSLGYQRQLNDRNQMMRCLQDIARTYYGLHRDADAFRYAREGMDMAMQTDARQNIRDGCQQLYLLYDREGRTDSAYNYYRRYIVMKDSVLSEWAKGKFASYDYEQQIKLQNKEKQLLEVCLREEMLTKNMLILGIFVLLLLSLVYVWVIRLKRRNEAHRRKRAEDELEIQRLEGERSKAALQQRAKELEVQALRSQMNPHFIFNCLNAINRFILGHETEAASDYLTKFSRLMRMIMNHSRHSTITLADEIEILQLYLDMERLRFKDAFDYRIDVEEDLDTEEIRIPPLLIQPFVENAVWHGLMHKEERGFLSIRMRLKDDVLTCIIRDNGIGRKQAALLKSKSAEKHKSMGLQITAERMALLTGSGEMQHFFQIDDLYEDTGLPAGTQVTLTIKIDQPAEEPVKPIS